MNMEQREYYTHIFGDQYKACFNIVLGKLVPHCSLMISILINIQSKREISALLCIVLFLNI